MTATKQTQLVVEVKRALEKFKRPGPFSGIEVQEALLPLMWLVQGEGAGEVLEPIEQPCHVCGEGSGTEIVKCKLDCDGHEQMFCETCSLLYAQYKKHFESNRALSSGAFRLLAGRRKDSIDRKANENVGLRILSGNSEAKG